MAEQAGGKMPVLKSTREQLSSSEIDKRLLNTQKIKEKLQDQHGLWRKSSNGKNKTPTAEMPRKKITVAEAKKLLKARQERQKYTYEG
jgi:hypothetical protein